MRFGVIDLLLIGGAAAIFLAPLLAGYVGFGTRGRRRPWLKKALFGMAGLQLLTLIGFGWLFLSSARQLNHAKWIAPLVVVDVLMWVCFGVGFAVATLRYRIKAKAQ